MSTFGMTNEPLTLWQTNMELYARWLSFGFVLIDTIHKFWRDTSCVSVVAFVIHLPITIK